MNKPSRHPIKKIAIDIIGVLLMIIAPFLGWIPGPGGIPIFLAGLSMVASNHEWAERKLRKIEKYAENAGSFLFPDIPIVKRSYDVATVILLAVGVYTLLNTSSVVLRILGTGCITTSLIIFIFNRQRYKKIIKQNHKH